MPVTKQCEHCGASYSRPPSIAIRSRFCGRGCAAAAQQTSERKDIACEACGNVFTAVQDHGAWPKYCSRDCFLAVCVRPAEKECAGCGVAFAAGRTNTGDSEDGRRIYCSAACANKGLRKSIERPCAACGALFYPANVTQNSDQKTCSRECQSAYFAGEKSPSYKGGAYLDKTVGEVRVLRLRAGYASKYMPSHRLAASKVIGRLVRRGEVVLRINNDKLDDRPENLFLCDSMSEAKRRMHGSLPWPGKSNLPSIAAAELAGADGLFTGLLK